MPNVLALETSSPILSVALKAGDRPVQESVLEGFLTHAENLLPLMDGLLRDAELSMNDIDTFLIGRGPGSFTGLRIGFATLKAVLALRSPKFFGALSLDMIADPISGKEGEHLAVCLDARRQKLYAKNYIYKEGVWTAQQEPKVLSAEEVIDSLAEGTLVVGDALERYSESFSKSSKKMRLLGKEEWYPRASTMISWLDRQHDSRLKKLEKPADFIPFYIRQSEAEERQKENASNC